MTHAMKKNMASMAMNPHDPTHKSTRNAHVFPCLKTGPLWAAFLEDPPDGGPADPNGPWSPGNGDIPSILLLVPTHIIHIVQRNFPCLAGFFLTNTNV